MELERHYKNTFKKNDLDEITRLPGEMGMHVVNQWEGETVGDIGGDGVEREGNTE